MELKSLQTPNDSPLLRCPRRVQERIFRLAYSTSCPIRLISTSGWRDQSSKSSTEKNKPFPGSKVNDFLVSKSYFAVAARAWARNQVFDLSHIEGSDQLFYASGIIWIFAKVLKIQPEQIQRLQNLPRVEKLVVDVSSKEVCQTNSQLMPWAIHLPDKDLESTPIFSSFSRLRGRRLSEVTLHALDCPAAASESQQELWKENVKALERCLIRRLDQNRAWRKRMLDMCPSRPKAKRVSSTRTHRALYPGSQVYFNDDTIEYLNSSSTTSSLRGIYPTDELPESTLTNDDYSSLFLDGIDDTLEASSLQPRHGSLIPEEEDVMPYLSATKAEPQLADIQDNDSKVSVPASPHLHGLSSTPKGEEIPLLDLEKIEFSTSRSTTMSDRDFIDEVVRPPRPVSIGSDTTVVSKDFNEEGTDFPLRHDNKTGEPQAVITELLQGKHEHIITARDQEFSGPMDETESTLALLTDVLFGGGMLAVLCFVWYATLIA